MRIRIINITGIGHDTEITHAETGDKIGGVYAADIHADHRGLVTAELTFNIPVIDIFAIAKLSEKT